MRTIYIKLSLLSLSLLILVACKKEAPLHDLNPPKVARLQLQGLVLTDTLEFVLDGAVIGKAIDVDFTLQDRLYTAGKKIQVRRKEDKKSLGEITINESPYKQVRKIFYDGTTFTDNIQLTQVTNPDNVGFRLRFVSQSSYFIGGPVDIEIMLRIFDPDTETFSYESTGQTIKNVTSDFSEFIELPPLDTYLKNYIFAILKPGTTDVPYREGGVLQSYSIPGKPTGNFPNFVSGESQLLSLTEDQPIPIDFGEYTITDFAYYFNN